MVATKEQTETGRLVNMLSKVEGNSDKLRGFKRALTCYVNKRSKETGRSKTRFIAAFKMQAKKMGVDTSML